LLTIEIARLEVADRHTRSRALQPPEKDVTYPVGYAEKKKSG
jgi:hypothetical protein